MSDVMLGRFGDCRLQKRGLLYSNLVKSGGRRVRVRALGGSQAGEIRLTRF